MKGLRYLRYHSLTWWAGAASVALGVAGIAGLNHPAYGQIAQVVSALLGSTDASPASLVVLGLGIIGIRDKLERKP